MTVADVEAARNARALRYEEDDHYDIISAFIKSIRGSDADAGLYWLARMLAAGEDPRFIARRLVILASEDVGMADPLALVVADAAARAVEFVGLPEAQLNLAQAVVHLASAPKSNRVMIGLSRAAADVRDQPTGQVPAHLRDSHYRSAARLGHGAGYRYPHDEPAGWVEQQYRPEHLEGRRYYEPSAHGAEADVASRLAARPPGGAEVAAPVKARPARRRPPWGPRSADRRPAARMGGRRLGGRDMLAARPDLGRDEPRADAGSVTGAGLLASSDLGTWRPSSSPWSAPPCCSPSSPSWCRSLDRRRLVRADPGRAAARSLGLLREIRGTVGQANNELDRADSLLVTAESVSTRVDSASRLAYMAFSNPVIKVLAFGSGTARATRRLPGTKRD